MLISQHVTRARCNVMARLTKTLKKELKSVSLPGTMGHTCEFVRSHIEALHSNHRKSIKMLNSVVQMAGRFMNCEIKYIARRKRFRQSGVPTLLQQPRVSASYHEEAQPRCVLF